MVAFLGGVTDDEVTRSVKDFFIMEAETTKETYAKAGVNIALAAKAKELIGKHARSTQRPEVLSDVGFFGGLFELKGYKEPVLVSSVDGVGTKLKVACALDKHDTIGIDIVNHCVNDILTCGAEPLFFLDYIAMGGPARPGPCPDPSAPVPADGSARETCRRTRRRPPACRSSFGPA